MSSSAGFPLRSIPSASPEVDVRHGSGSGSDYTDSSGRQSPGTPPDLSALEAECHPDSLPCTPDIIIPGILPSICTRLEGEPCPPLPGGISPGGSKTQALRRRLRTISGSKAENLVMRKGEKLVYTAGRPPWYDTTGQTHREPFIIGISGGSASGKTTVANRIIEQLDIPWVTLLSLDSFYKVLSKEQHSLAANNEYDFDHPEAFDFDLCEDTLRKLREGKMAEVPIYNFTSLSREKHCKTMYGADVLIFEGIMGFYKQKIVDLMDLKIFVDTDGDIRLARRLKRDIVDRGRDVEGVIKQYSRTVKPSYDNYIAPSMRHADIIIPRGGENVIAIDLIVKHIMKKLKERGYCNRSQLAKIESGLPIPDCVHILKETSQIKGLHTFVRNRETSPDEFIFYSKRLMRLLIEYALSLLPYLETPVDTPQGTKYIGRKRNANICGVSILRAGETMEPALREVVKDCKMGKMLIQTNPDTEDPELYYLRLPKDIHRYHVFLMDATVATGAAAMMAIRVLLDHDVPEENIILLSLLSAEAGVQSVAYAFPRVKQVTTAIDPHLSQNYYILPGLGNFGDRYFGTTYDPEMEDNDEYEGDAQDMGGATTEEDE